MKTLLKIILICPLFLVVSFDTSDHEKKVNDLLKNYDKSLSPSVAAGQDSSTKVKLGIYVISLHFLENNEYEMLIYLRQFWRDERLKFRGKPMIVTESRNKFWKPDTFLRSSLEMKSFDVPEDQTLFKISDNGTVWYVRRLLIKGFCSSEDASNFPMDKRSCSLMFESFSYTADQFYFEPKTPAIEMDSKLKPSDDRNDWTLLDRSVSDCSENYTSGTYSCLQMEFLFNREPGSYKLSVFVPSSILTILALLPLLIGSKQSLISKLLPAVIAQLGLVMLSAEAYKNAPVKSTVTRMHTWMIFHHVFFLLILIVVILLDKLTRQPKLTETEEEKARAGGGRLAGVRSKLNQFGWIIDLILIVVFVVIYVLFRISFWASAPPA